MAQQFYVSPEQVMKDRADFARKGIARGKSVVVLSCRDGMALVAENPSSTLHKIGEIYDRIAFAAVGKYNEFESLRQAGVRYADVRGYSYDRVDVTARGLASVYAQSLGTVFTAEQKPFEVELAVAEVGRSEGEDHIFRLNFDGSIADESNFLAMGGQAELVQGALGKLWTPGASLGQALRWAVTALEAPRAPAESAGTSTGAATRAGASVAAGTGAHLPAAILEVAVLDRNTPAVGGSHRAFRRLDDTEVARALAANL
ncbi:20S proteasome subunit alpha or beta [Arthrobacter sp. PAMC 25486]|uniref:proteasome subunit alpha n=1 Tax=Arthrobacter sp. PAMC 25486 TaxID=1494608 RepID=UPI000535F1F2|nr:proteasome subunit alpha [Arthrobacter sp. PAMC 25486]AIY00266.1 20S proteasome subunit alpha or beta [Arthrobacter sp. PAMC 25486]